MFKSPDQQNKERVGQSGKKLCSACNGTGTYGVGGRGSSTSSTCSKCKGTGEA